MTLSSRTFKDHETKSGVFNAIFSHLATMMGQQVMFKNTRAGSIDPSSLCSYTNRSQGQHAYGVIRHSFIFLQLWVLRLRLYASEHSRAHSRLHPPFQPKPIFVEATF
jgi:hypothetical protein